MLRPPRQELSSLVRLAVPVVIAELGWVAMGVVDTLMVGRLGDEAIGAVGIGRALFLGVGVFGIGLLLGLDTVISNSFGAGKLERCRSALWHGVLIAVTIAIPLTFLVRQMSGWLDSWGVDPKVFEHVVAYTKTLSWSALPIFLYAAVRRYLQAMHRVIAVMFALISANLVNVATNWLLIFGNLGMPEMGVRGAAWATVLSSSYMALFLGIVAWHHAARLIPDKKFNWSIERALTGRLLSLGLPAGLQLLLEVGVFALSTVLAGKLAPAALAAHQVVINVASTTYMVPLGISQATSVRVGHKLGAGDPEAARRVGWMGIGLAAGFMSLAALGLIVFPRFILNLWKASPEAVAIGSTLFVAAAIFQLFDGMQVAAIGALRGLGDTRSALYWNVVGYWVITLPVGYLLCFNYGLGALGLWIGFCVGLMTCGVALVWRWSVVSRNARPLVL
jgi:MATE family multidrug resistance protein